MDSIWATHNLKFFIHHVGVVGVPPFLTSSHDLVFKVAVRTQLFVTAGRYLAMGLCGSELEFFNSRTAKVSKLCSLFTGLLEAYSS